MRIRDLFENKELDKDLQFIKKNGDKTEIDYDLVEDLAFFMNNDDDTYRRHLYPSLTNCLERIKQNKPTAPSLFTNAVREGYKNYLRKFPMRELPDELEDKIQLEACKKMYEELCKHNEEGKYKD